MPHQWLIAGVLCGILTLPVLSQASPGDVGPLIEAFVSREFPDTDSHYWVINGTQWEEDEIIVDIHTIVNDRRDAEPIVNHFLLLIVAGELRGVQNIPLEPGTDCRAEKEA